jgi:hypothetical protein
VGVSVNEETSRGIQTFISSAISLLFVFCIPRLTAIFTTKLFSQSLTIAAAKP